ncbi:leucine-rich repeat extensin-like protein 1 [Dendrobium catenatum]|uniref:leucine-rich repeat extensin-like protein 1 n=1 Tax=Dendrobium catenatum TaxID=906689 RepID=UPI0009F48EFD|nr:leucine-rich repeat extensin-like protein 1 [Dendrobium catenatum]
MTSGDDPPCKLFASKFRRKKLSVTPSIARQPDEGEGPSVPPVLPTPAPPRSQQQSPSEQGQGQSDPPAIVPLSFPGYFPPPSTSPHFSSPDQAHAAPFYPYYPPLSSQAAGQSTGPHPPYPYPYYYPYPVQPEHGGPSRPAEVGAWDHAAATDKRQYIEPEGDK